MKRRRLWLPIPILAVLVAAGALFLLRNDDPSGGSAEAASQVRAAFARIEDLSSFSMRQTTVSYADGQLITVEQELSIEIPDRAYGRTTVEGQSNEVVILGEQVFYRAEGASWLETDLRTIGIDPQAMYRTDQQAFLPDELTIKGEVSKNGLDMIHYYAKVDGQRLEDMLTNLFLENSSLSRVFERVTIQEIEVDYYLGKIDQLPYRAEIRMKYSLDGHEVKTSGEVEYFDFNAPLVLPEDLPVTP